MFMLFFCMKRYASSTHSLYLNYFLISFHFSKMINTFCTFIINSSDENDCYSLHIDVNIAVDYLLLLTIFFIIFD